MTPRLTSKLLHLAWVSVLTIDIVEPCRPLFEARRGIKPSRRFGMSYWRNWKRLCQAYQQTFLKLKALIHHRRTSDWAVPGILIYITPTVEVALESPSYVNMYLNRGHSKHYFFLPLLVQIAPAQFRIIKQLRRN